MTKILMEFERGGEITATLSEDRAPQTYQSVLEALPAEAEVLHAMWAGEEIFFRHFPAEFAYEHPPQEVTPGTLAMVPRSSPFCIFYGRSIPRGAVDEEINVAIFGQVDDVEAMAGIGRRVLRQGVETVRITES